MLRRGSARIFHSTDRHRIVVPTRRGSNHGAQLVAGVIASAASRERLVGNRIYTRQYEILLGMLREARANSGLTQVEVAEKLEISQSDVSKCEQGARRLDVIELKLWVEALGGRLPEFLQAFEARLSVDLIGQVPAGLPP